MYCKSRLSLRVFMFCLRLYLFTSFFFLCILRDLHVFFLWPSDGTVKINLRMIYWCKYSTCRWFKATLIFNHYAKAPKCKSFYTYIFPENKTYRIEFLIQYIKYCLCNSPVNSLIWITSPKQCTYVIETSPGFFPEEGLYVLKHWFI